ncbi:MAG: GNAT family N-acetyltransferase [Nitriliruptoraceae bacterium]
MVHVVPIDNPRVAGLVSRMLEAPDHVVTARVHGVRVPLVDESDAERLAALAAGGPASAGWRAWCAIVGSPDTAVPEQVVGYASVARSSVSAVAELVAAADGPAWDPLFDRVHRVVGGAGRSVELWIRNVDAGSRARLDAAGLVANRELAVLGRALDASVSERVPRRATIRPASLPADRAAIVAVLDAAYRGTADGPWDRARFDARAVAGWFRVDDVLVAVDDSDALVGVHWLKRRDARVGEVYNLAVHPDAHGRGVGGALLNAGLRHLRDAGLATVILWVDRANPRAAQLYEAAGFTVYWQDACFAPVSGVLGSA